MNEQMWQRIDQLAAKLNTTGEHLWGVLVAQARVQVALNITFGLVGVVIILIALYCSTRAIEGLEDDNAGFAIVAIILGVVGPIIFLVNLYNLWTPLLNPEYFALQTLLNALTGRDK